MFKRKAGLEKVRDHFVDCQVEFVLVEDGGVYDALLVLCGCSSSCADTSHYRATVTVVVDGEDSLLPALDGLDCVIRGAATL